MQWRWKSRSDRINCQLFASVSGSDWHFTNPTLILLESKCGHHMRSPSSIAHSRSMSCVSYCNSSSLTQWLTTRLFFFLALKPCHTRIGCSETSVIENWRFPPSVCCVAFFVSFIHHHPCARNGTNSGGGIVILFCVLQLQPGIWIADYIGWMRLTIILTVDGLHHLISCKMRPLKRW